MVVAIKRHIRGDTNVELYGGKYNRVYGGSLNAAVTGSNKYNFWWKM